MVTDPKLLEKGLAVFIAFALLKILSDAVYQKIPDGFKAIKDVIEAECDRSKDRHTEAIRHLEGMEFAITDLREERCSEKHSRDDRHRPPPGRRRAPRK